jgi:hypothetical protein
VQNTGHESKKTKNDVDEKVFVKANLQKGGERRQEYGYNRQYNFIVHANNGPYKLEIQF